MKESGKIIEITFELLRSGLWNREIQLLPYSPIDYSAIYKVAESQSIVGLVATGLEHVTDIRVLKQDALPFMKKVFSLESRNAAMNQFIEELVGKMRKVGVYAILIKGQGVAQCYERPQWRSAGDIDLLFDGDNYIRARDYLTPLSVLIEQERRYTKHLGMNIGSWTVELHGTIRCGLTPKIDKKMDAIHEDIFVKGNVRAWRDGGTDVFLPGPDDDIFIIFTHFLSHFYKGGVGLRQICDWCRLIWTYRESINVDLLKERLSSMRLMSVWKAFAAFAVGTLGMPAEAMPLYDDSLKWARKAKRIKKFVLKSGNFGHNRDTCYYSNCPYLLRKTISFCRRIVDIWRHTFIFPVESLCFLPGIIYNGVRSALLGE